MPTSALDSEDRPNLSTAEAQSQADEAIAALVAELQQGWDRHESDVADRHLAADVAWGSPYGAAVHGYDRLHAIHVKLKQQSTGGAASRYNIDRAFAVSDDVVVAHVARQALNSEGNPIEPTSDTTGAFSEMALYVLVRRNGTWWLAAGQNTPVRPGGAA